MIEKPYQGIRTFCKVSDKELASHIFAIVGIGVDSGTSFKPGTRLAPAAIRDASLMLTDGVNIEFPVDITKYTIDLGDINVTNGNTSKMNMSSCTGCNSQCIHVYKRHSLLRLSKH